jgi:hypothetical protein
MNLTHLSTPISTPTSDSIAYRVYVRSISSPWRHFCTEDTLDKAKISVIQSGYSLWLITERTISEKVAITA